MLFRSHQPRHEPLQQLALAEDDLGLAAHPLRDRTRPVRGTRLDHKLRQEESTAREQAAADGDERREQDGAYARTFRSSALIAGTISWRSPMTA